MNNRFLNMVYFIEVIEGRLNGSAEQVERKKTGFDNVSYVKKIGNRGLVSAPCQKWNMKKFMNFKGYELSKRMKNGKKIAISALPHKFIDEAIFGFMRADKEELTEEQYNELSKEEQNSFKKKGKNKYGRNITKKRKSRFLMSPLINVSNKKINFEWNVSSTDGDSLPYCVETYAGIFAGIANVDINNINKFTISNNEAEFRDYSNLENIEEKDIQLSKKEKYNRIKVAIQGLQYLSIEGNQNNHLTDTTPKFIILAEYSWGNNVFQGIIKEKGIDIEALEETLEDNDEFRLSNVWIGVSTRIENEDFQELKKQLQEELKDYDYIKIGTIKNSFDKYLKYLKETL